MAARTYDNFDLLVEAGQDGSYRARVTASPSGESGESTFTLPFDGTSLENLLLRLDPGRSGVRRGSVDPRVEVGKQLGEGLFESLFSGDVALAWARARDAVDAEGKGLRLRLRLDDAPALAGLPWELLYDRRRGTYLAQSERTPVVRYLDVRQTLRPLHVGGALHVLAVISAPTDLPELDVEAEWARVQEALRERVDAGTVILERLPEPTLTALGTWLRRHTAHVLHFVGHGDYDGSLEEGVLYFCDRYGRSVPVTASVLGPYIYDHDPLRLLVLNACRSASVGQDDPFAGMAQGLVRQNSSAVIAMQFPITDQAAVTFTGEFYGAVADEYPVDQAVTYARKALFASYGAEWATPTLFMQAHDGKVFDTIVPESVPKPIPEPEPDPDPEPEPEPAQKQEAPPTPVPEPGPTRQVISAPVPEPEPQPEPEPEPRRAPEPEPEGQPDPRPEPERQPVPDQGSWQDEEPIEFHVRHRKGLVPTLSVGGGVLAIAAAAVLWTMFGQEDEPEDPGTTTVEPGMKAAEPGAELVAHYLEAPSMDGDPGDWPGVAPSVSEKVIVQTEHTTKADADWSLGWNEDFLFLFVDVLDGEITQTHEDSPADAIAGDSISFEFGPWLEPSPVAALHPDDRFLIIGPTEDERAIAAVGHPQGPQFDTQGESVENVGQVFVGFTEDGYEIEAAIPWDVLGVTDPAARKYAMNVNFSDAIRDGEERGELATLQSNNSQRLSNDADLRYVWGTVELQGG